MNVKRTPTGSSIQRTVQLGVAKMASAFAFSPLCFKCPCEQNINVCDRGPTFRDKSQMLRSGQGSRATIPQRRKAILIGPQGRSLMRGRWYSIRLPSQVPQCSARWPLSPPPLRPQTIPSLTRWAVVPPPARLRIPSWLRQVQNLPHARFSRRP